MKLKKFFALALAAATLALIVKVKEARIAISAEMAQKIYV